jgi:hypothetical protein
MSANSFFFLFYFILETSRNGAEKLRPRLDLGTDGIKVTSDAVSLRCRELMLEKKHSSWIQTRSQERRGFVTVRFTHCQTSPLQG